MLRFDVAQSISNLLIVDPSVQECDATGDAQNMYCRAQKILFLNNGNFSQTEHRTSV